MEQNLETSKKIRKVPPTGTPEYREYARQAKRRSREKEKQEREAAQILTYDEALNQFWSSPDYGRMNAYTKQESKKIADELGATLDGLADEAINFVLSVSFGFKNGIVRQVSDPNGQLVGYLFPDAIGGLIVSRTHEYGLERSATFSNIYRELLTLLDKKYGVNNDGHSRAVKQELAGS